LATGDKAAEAELMPHVYSELKRLAASYLRRERPGHTLQATALVHEAYMKLAGQQNLNWQNRSHFFAMAAQVMRRILTDHARLHGAAKRGAGRPKLNIDDVAVVGAAPCDQIDDLDEALTRLAALAKVVEMRFFGGMTEEEIAGILQLSSRTIKRDWIIARAWLFGELAS
jgi:RNA polymerase sigma factor (TIGR02999 family)